MKRKKLWIFLLFVLLFTGLRHLTKERSELGHALDLTFLPFSVRIVESGREVWTDYLYEATITLDPDDFEKLISGRDFKKSKWNGDYTSPNWIPSHEPFKIAEEWEWESESENPNKGAYCTVQANAKRDMVFIQFAVF